MTDPIGHAAGSIDRWHENPGIYTSTNGRVMVKDELLNFPVVKWSSLTQDDIILLTLS